VFDSARVERGAPAAFIVAGDLKIVPLPRHADCDVADA
jgi:hypothetical protein